MSWHAQRVEWMQVTLAIGHGIKVSRAAIERRLGHPIAEASDDQLRAIAAALEAVAEVAPPPTPRLMPNRRRAA